MKWTRTGQARASLQDDSLGRLRLFRCSENGAKRMSKQAHSAAPKEPAVPSLDGSVVVPSSVWFLVYCGRHT